MNLPARITGASSPSVLPSGTTDDGLIAMWLHDKPATTQRTYRRAVDTFRAFVQQPLQLVTLADFYAFNDAMKVQTPPLAPATQKKTISAIKSLLSFAHRTGYLTFNVGAMVKPPKLEDTLAERILGEDDVLLMLRMERNPRNHAILRLLYHGGLRVSEMAALKWRNLTPNGDTGQVNVMGKGSKPRPIVLDKSTWDELQGMRRGAALDSPVFVSRTSHYHRQADLDVLTPGMTTTQIWRIVKAAGKRIGLERLPSPHWLRHAHASHALDGGAPIHLVQATLGHANMSTTGKYSHAKPKESSAKYLKG